MFAEDEGFKPPIPVMGIPDFESSAFGHSANLPNLQPLKTVAVIFYVCKDNTIFSFGKEFLTQMKVFQALTLDILLPISLCRV